MAQVIAIPSCTASPANGGSVTYAQGTSGTITGLMSAYQNYVFTATPAPGFRFSHFSVTSSVSDDIQPHDTHISTTDNPYASTATSDVYDVAGAAWWWFLDYGGGITTEAWVNSISVVAVFEPRNSGALVYSENQNGQLVYSGSQGGALVYDGDFAGNNSGTT